MTSADPLRAEVDLLRVEVDRLRAEADPLHAASVLIIGVDYAPTSTDLAQHTTAMARDLAEVVALVMVFTGIPADAQTRFSRFGGRTRRTIENDRGVHLVRHRHARFERGFRRAVLGTPVRNRPDVVIAVLPSVGAAVAAARVAARVAAPLMLVVHELTTIRTRAAAPVGSGVAGGEMDALRHAARVVLIGTGLHSRVSALGVEEARIGPEGDVRAALRGVLTRLG